MQLKTLEERYNYLKLNAGVGETTFDTERYLNQRFYTSAEWRRVRRLVTVRDEGCELGIKDFPISGRLYVHHMNPMRPEDLVEFNADVLNPEYLITVSHDTHNAIHYGSEDLLPKPMVERQPGDTRLW